MADLIFLALRLAAVIGWPVGVYLSRVWNGERTWVDPVMKAVEGLFFDLEHRRITRAEVLVRLTPKEFGVLATLVRKAGKVIPHGDLLTTVWGAAHAEDTQYLRVIVAQLRHKLEANADHPTLIVTEPGVGYRLAV